MRNAFLLPLAAAAIVATGAALTTLDRENARRATRTGTGDDGAAADRRRAESAAKQRETAQARLDDADARDDAWPPEASLATVGTSAADDASPERHEQVLFSRLDSEPIDAHWSRETEGAVADAFAGEAFAGARLVDTQCGSTLCRVELTAGDDNDREQAMSAIPMTKPFASDGLILDRRDEEGTVVLFFTRQGTALL